MEWISVKDRLPPEGINVLLYNDNFKIFEVGNLWKHEYDDFVKVEGTEYFKKEKGSNLMFSNNDASHWMPLPEPPKS